MTKARPITPSATTKPGRLEKRAKVTPDKSERFSRLLGVCFVGFGLVILVLSVPAGAVELSGMGRLALCKREENYIDECP